MMRDLAVLLAGAVILATTGAIGNWLDQPWFWIAALSATTLLFAWLYLMSHGRLKKGFASPQSSEAEARPLHWDPRISTKPPGGHTVVGIDIGRSRISYGVFRVDNCPNDRLPEPEDRHILAVPHHLRASIDSPDLYRELADGVAHLTREIHSLDGIGVGLPGQVNALRGSLADSPGALRSGEEFVTRFAQSLANHRSIGTAFDIDAGSGQPDESLRRAIAARILIDNDVRCATRYVQSSVGGDRTWQNFACIVVGSGLGTGLVLNRVLYYGTGGSAGEAGHMTVHLSDAVPCHPFASPENGHTEFHPRECACGRQGVHWEALTNGQALVDLAYQINTDVAIRIAGAFGSSPSGKPALTAEHLGMAAALVEGHDAEASQALRDVMKDPMAHDFIVSLVKTYTYYFTAGVANLINILNLDHIVLGGGVMDGLAPLRMFRNEWNRVLELHALRVPCHTLEPFLHDEGARVGSTGTAQPGWAWIGAALLFWDPSYHTFRQSRAAISPEPIPV